MTKQLKTLSRRQWLKVGAASIAAGITVPSWLTAAVPAVGVPLSPSSLLDQVNFGDSRSEQQHALTTQGSQTETGALGQSSRRLLPGGPQPWEGGRIAFTVKVHPQRQTYVTARFWGGEANQNYLILFCDGKQVGYRHLGDIDVLANPDDEPRYNGRFYYVTTPLPPAMTAGKTSVALEIRATGNIWGYGSTFEQYQKPMTVPSRGIYRLYTHTEGCFVPPVDEVQGTAPHGSLRSAPGPETLQQAKDRVNTALMGMLTSRRPLDQMQMQFLAKAYFVPCAAAFQNPQVVTQMITGVDNYYRRWKTDPQSVWQDRATWNPGWFGVGPAGDAVRLLVTALEPSLDQPLDSSLDANLPRRAAWSAMFQSGRDYLRRHRRWLTNQVMFTDVNLYLANRAVAAIDPPHALPETQALDYLYQAIGLAPWLGSDTDHGPEMPFGPDFYQVTDKGLTRELGYVGGYGEVGTGEVMEIYEATRVPGGEGDPKIKAQLAKMIRARGHFRYPMLDADGCWAMRLETGVGWRDEDFPGEVVYVQPSGGEQSALREAAATLDPYAIGYAQQMFSDNQFFQSVADALANPRFRNTVGLLGTPDQYDLLQAQPVSPHRLPMSAGHPDFVFADEQNGVVAIKNGEEFLFVSLYWRANFAINFLARLHYLTPRYQQVAVVREDVQYVPSGQSYTRPDWINFGFGNGGTNIHYPSDLHQAYAGQTLPIAKSPVRLNLSADEPDRYAGMGEFYTLRFGPYLIGMNMTKDKTYDLSIPADLRLMRELTPPRRKMDAGSTVKVGPLSTVVYYSQYYSQ